MSESTFNITNSIHPDYFNLTLDWRKYRFVSEGGEDFIEEYLKSFSDRESTLDFEARKLISPVPGFASASLVDIKNAIFQRMVDITRVDGSASYQEVINGLSGGVDLKGASMNFFIGNAVLPELLNMGKIGVYTDMPAIDGVSINDSRKDHPYFYVYKAEDIRNWRLAVRGDFVEFDMLLLRETVLTFDDIVFLPDKDLIRYRLLTHSDDGVKIRLYNDDGVQIDSNGIESDFEVILDIEKIPFTLFELNHSLLKDIANHQIALLNLESSDISYSLKSNFPFYVEQQSHTQSPHLKSQEDEDGDGRRQADIGGTVGRTYPAGLDPPMFIHPSGEPLTVSMEKQKQLKDDIRVLVNLALSAVQPKFASAESKQMDEHGLESGLSFLGMVLEHGERQMAEFYRIYENTKEKPTITYPERYALKSVASRLAEAKELSVISVAIPSKTGQKEIAKSIARKVLDTQVSPKRMSDIISEIEEAEYVTSNPETIHSDLEKGLVSTETASTARGYNSKVEVPKAEKDHAKRAARILESQTAARGVSDLSTNS
ncbi:hypothetical protein LCGC14_0673680, partial [marine sediment metagenome]